MYIINTPSNKYKLVLYTLKQAKEVAKRKAYLEGPTSLWYGDTYLTTYEPKEKWQRGKWTLKLERRKTFRIYLLDDGFMSQVLLYDDVKGKAVWDDPFKVPDSVKEWVEKLVYTFEQRCI